MFPGTYSLAQKRYTPPPQSDLTWDKFHRLSLVCNQQLSRSSVVDVIPSAKLLQLHQFQEDHKIPLRGALREIFLAFRAAGFPYWAEDQFLAAEPYFWFVNLVTPWEVAPSIWSFLLEHSRTCTRGSQETHKNSECGLTPAKLRSAPKIGEWGQEAGLLPCFMQLCCPIDPADKPATFKHMKPYADRFALWTDVRGAVRLHCASSPAFKDAQPSAEQLLADFVKWASQSLVCCISPFFLSIVSCAEGPHVGSLGARSYAEGPHVGSLGARVPLSSPI